MIPPDIIFRVIRQFTHLLVKENKRYPQEEMRYALLACKILVLNNCTPPLLYNSDFPTIKDPSPITDTIPPDIIFRVIRQFTHLLVRENKRYPREEMRYALLACKTLLVSNCASPL
ncbi:hypothetical protein CDAR_227441 [Caerostris darwini]|uniref:Uncharacterized protein n=1 Tax=Caerostris darwini TaxID=1538125 RepID=A0AAV4UM53_9ARAC|nr:hypothetical protein CDAR_227441 [Caerostris darwini]